MAPVVEGRRRPRRWGGAGDSGEALATAWRGGGGRCCWGPPHPTSRERERRREHGAASAEGIVVRCAGAAVSLSVSPVVAAVGDRPVEAVVEGRRRTRLCVCVSVHDLREKRLSVECFCLPSA